MDVPEPPLIAEVIPTPGTLFTVVSSDVIKASRKHVGVLRYVEPEPIEVVRHVFRMYSELLIANDQIEQALAL